MVMHRILLVEDDSILAFSVEYALKEEGFEIRVAYNLEMARQFLNKFDFDLVLLDMKLPDGNGYELCDEILQSFGIPVIFLTACDEEANIVQGLDMGADDYITKPFRIRELVSRIGAVLRRSGKDVGKSEVITSGDLQVYTLEGKVSKKDAEILVTALEYRLLLILMSNAKHILSRDSILNGLLNIDGEFIDDNSLSVYIRRLRQKIEDDPAHPKYIMTARGMGYKWDCDVRG